ncbi:hypothetical protein EG328_005653 [Venturia inaequalis]|uniref:CID domain-containing protein n=1 Tax=Venturia inaequalis TaxID=5025 RepID=A0A8H3VQW3_VENIN|nr:hypothetical protein EG328_005653 [Venturia inaequalis]KAE9994877.1 hypothetical protein EG327_000091 [Venturia inaequalis]RDI83672.1 hypothetical protein Vi05172_g6220 [Venturia inaequalis]
MSYTGDAVRAKLSALNETQEAIVTVAQWIMFHRKHSKETAQVWAQRLKDSPAPRRLNLIYLANEVVQQSKARKRSEFVDDFGPIIPEATADAYRGATIDIQQKIRRVVEVWRERKIFQPAVQSEVEAKIDELDKARGGGKKPALGGSLFSASSAPPEYQTILSHQAKITKSEVLSKPTIASALAEYEKQTSPSAPIPSAPVHAARLSALLKTLANAEGAVAESVKARRALVEGLEKILTRNKEELVKEEAQLADINSKKTLTDAKRREVEDGIIRGLANEAEPERPESEPLTPPMPPIESITPVGTPKGFVTTTGADVIKEEPNNFAEPEPPAFDMLPQRLLEEEGTFAKQAPTNGSGEEPSAKKRKIANMVGVDEYAEFADGGLKIDADIEAML